MARRLCTSQHTSPALIQMQTPDFHQQNCVDTTGLANICDNHRITTIICGSFTFHKRQALRFPFENVRLFPLLRTKWKIHLFHFLPKASKHYVSSKHIKKEPSPAHNRARQA